MPASDPVATQRAAPSPVTLATYLVLAVWLAMPFLQRGVLAEDASPFVTAGQLVVDEPEALYPQPETDTSWTLHPRFAELGCDNLPEGEDCGQYVVPFISPPSSLPLAWLAGLAGEDGGVLAFRLVGASGAVAGLLLLRQRLERVRGPSAIVVLLTAVLLTPIVYVTVLFGQSSPLMFASVALGVAGSASARRGIAAAGLWALTSALKLFPLGLAAVLVLQRRWRLLALSAAALAGLTLVGLALAPPGTWIDFVDSTRSVSVTTVSNDYNLSLDAAVQEVATSWGATSTGFTASLLARVAVLAGVFWWRLRRAPADVQWAFGWVALIAAQPQRWWHYDVVAVAALAVAVAAVPGRRGVNLWFVVGGAALTVPLALLTSQLVLIATSHVLLVGTLAYLAARPGVDAPLQRSTATARAGSRQGAVEGGSVHA